MKNNQPSLSTPMEILETALSREKSAYDFYEKLLGNTSIGMLQEIIEHLLQEEYKHIQLIEKKMATLRSS